MQISFSALTRTEQRWSRTPENVAFTTSSSSSGSPREGPGRGELSLASLRERFQKILFANRQGFISPPQSRCHHALPFPGAPQHLWGFRRDSCGVFKLPGCNLSPLTPKTPSPCTQGAAAPHPACCKNLLQQHTKIKSFFIPRHCEPEAPVSLERQKVLLNTPNTPKTVCPSPRKSYFGCSR